MAIQFSSYHNSIANFQDKSEEENEDFLKISLSTDKYSSFAICDGAGGAGVFSGEWAKYLVNALPDSPKEFKEKSKDWFFETSQKFHEAIIAKKDLSDLMLNKKVYSDGSFSTLCACWIDTSENMLYYTAEGDTFLFLFEKLKSDYVPIEIFPLNDFQNINQNPRLLNWSLPIESGLKVKQKVLKPDFVILLASDSLAKWIILNLFLSDSICIENLGVNQNYLKSLSEETIRTFKEAIALSSGVKSFNELLSFLKNIASDKNKFNTVLKELYTNSELEIDDYSLIYIEGNVS